jgi:hypothetical protein
VKKAPSHPYTCSELQHSFEPSTPTDADGSSGGGRQQAHRGWELQRWGRSTGGSGTAREAVAGESNDSNRGVGAPFSTRRRRGQRGRLEGVNSVRGRSRGSAGL